MNSLPPLNSTDQVIFSKTHSLSTKFGDFETRIARYGSSNDEALVILNETNIDEKMFLRVQFGCAYGHVLSSIDCDCRQQTDETLGVIGAKQGLFVYFGRHEAYGAGLFEKANMMHFEKNDPEYHSTVINEHKTSDKNLEIMTAASNIIKLVLPERKFVYLGNNKQKIESLRKNGIDIESQTKIKIDENTVSEFGRAEIYLKNS